MFHVEHFCYLIEYQKNNLLIFVFDDLSHNKAKNLVFYNRFVSEVHKKM